MDLLWWIISLDWVLKWTLIIGMIGVVTFAFAMGILYFLSLFLPDEPEEEETWEDMEDPWD